MYVYTACQIQLTWEIQGSIWRHFLHFSKSGCISEAIACRAKGDNWIRGELYKVSQVYFTSKVARSIWIHSVLFFFKIGSKLGNCRCSGMCLWVSSTLCAMYCWLFTFQGQFRVTLCTLWNWLVTRKLGLVETCALYLSREYCRLTVEFTLYV